MCPWRQQQRFYEGCIVKQDFQTVIPFPEEVSSDSYLTTNCVSLFEILLESSSFLLLITLYIFISQRLCEGFDSQSCTELIQSKSMDFSGFR